MRHVSFAIELIRLLTGEIMEPNFYYHIFVLGEIQLIKSNIKLGLIL